MDLNCISFRERSEPVAALLVMQARGIQAMSTSQRWVRVSTLWKSWLRIQNYGFAEICAYRRGRAAIPRSVRGISNFLGGKMRALAVGQFDPLSRPEYQLAV